MVEKRRAEKFTETKSEVQESESDIIATAPAVCSIHSMSDSTPCGVWEA